MEARKIEPENTITHEEALELKRGFDIYLSILRAKVEIAKADAEIKRLKKIRRVRRLIFATNVLGAGIVLAVLYLILSAVIAHAERPPLDIPNRTYSHPVQSIIVEEADGWKLCGLDKQCLAELAAGIGGDTRTLVFFKAPTTFYIEGCYGNETCYGGGPITKISWVKCGASGLDPETEFGACQAEAATGRLMWDEFDFSINYQCQYMRRKAHNRIGRVANPSECYQRLATQSRRECIKDYFSPRYVCGYHKGETKNQWSAWVVEK